ncbi:MAG TPA: RecX family transcriptional regulator [Chloroflexota bacterium]
MPQITALSLQKNDPERINVEIDGRFAFGISRMLAASRGLSTGQELTPAEVEALRHDDDAERAHNAALNFLTFRPRSNKEIADYLRKRKTEPEVIAAVVERLQGSGLIDDDEFARFWVENRQSFRPRGSRALRAELRQKGLAADVIEGTLNNLGDEEPAAIKAGRSKLRSYEKLEDAEFVRKMTAFLQRRGFAYDVSARAARQLLEESDRGIS